MSKCVYVNITKINNVLSENIKIYPNPVGDILNISFENLENSVINITDIYGRKIYEQNIYESQNAIDVYSFQNGIYILTIRNNSGFVRTLKFVKN